MPRLKDNDPAKWQYSQHVRIKHEVLTRYVDPWTTILGKYNLELAYVDGFAGRGRYWPENEPGSPLLAATKMQEAVGRKGHRVERIDLHLVERDSTNLADLQREMSNHPVSQDSRFRIHYYPMSFSAASPAIINQVAARRQPGFFFLDPFGYDDLPMTLIERIVHLPKCEAFINYMFNFIQWGGGMSQPALLDTLDRLHGNESWRECNSVSGTARENCLRENYRQELKHRGAKYVIPFRMGADETDRTLYYLFHASGHPKAAREMKREMVRMSSPGHLGYAGEARHQWRPLFDFDADALPDLLWQLFRGQHLTFDDVIDQSIELSGTCIEPNYRQVLKDMEARREITVTRVTSKTPRGLSGHDIIKFELPR